MGSRALFNPVFINIASTGLFLRGYLSLNHPQRIQKNKITKNFHFITEKYFSLVHFPVIHAAIYFGLLASNMAAVNFRCKTAALKTSKEWPFCSILYSVSIVLGYKTALSFTIKLYFTITGKL
jgi:hypothetical protein